MMSRNAPSLSTSCKFARKCCGEIKTESVDMHVEHPITQAVHDQLQHAGVPHVQRVSGSGVVHVVAGIVGNQSVIDAIVDAAE